MRLILVRVETMKQPWGTSSSQGPRAQRYGDEHASKEAGWSLLKSIGTGRLCCMARLRNLTIALKKKYRAYIIRASESLMWSLGPASFTSTAAHRGRFCRPAFKMAKCTGKGRTQIASSMLVCVPTKRGCSSTTPTHTSKIGHFCNPARLMDNSAYRIFPA